jgi:hypothetical protein
MNPRSRRAALYAIGLIAILASVNALAHSYAGLYDWAVHHRLGGWQAMSWPAEIDVFLAIGELALYVAYLDGWPGRQRVWPWATALTGLSVSVAGNIGHVVGAPGQPVLLTDRLTAATSPVAAFAGLAIGLLVLKMTRRQAGSEQAGEANSATGDLSVSGHVGASVVGPRPVAAVAVDGSVPRPEVVGAARAICADATARGERLSQRALARQLRDHGHRFPNQDLRHIAEIATLSAAQAA